MYNIQLQFEEIINGYLTPDFTHISQVEVPIEVIDEDLETIVEETRALRAPQPVPVPKEGQYQVRVRLPSGERVSAMVTVPPETGGMPVAVLRSKDYSLHETLAWAYTAQGIKRVTNLPTRASLESIAPSEPVAFGAMYEIGGWNEEQTFWELTRLPDLQRPVETEGLEDRRLALRWRGGLPHWVESEPRTRRPVYQSYTHGKHAPYVALFAVPPTTGWADMLLVKTGENSGTGLRPMVRGNNPQADALLSYLCQDAFESARLVGDRLADELGMLMGEGDDPTSAVVAGYYMLKASYIRHEDWLQKLAEGFTGLPDGAVIFGWALLRREEPDYGGARHFFLTAVRRGIPMYSTGLRLLYDGLNVLLDYKEEDKEVHRMFQAVRRIAAATDWKANVTSFSPPEAVFKWSQEERAAVAPPLRGGMIYEVRTYTLKPGTVIEFEERFAKRLPLLEKHSKLGAFWHTEMGPLNEVIYVWPYEDLQQRAAVREAMAKDTAMAQLPGYQDLIVAQEAEIMIPAPFMHPLVWVYKDLTERTRVREASRQFSGAWPPQTGVRPIRQENKLLISAAFSPVR
jgi:hypothetical protein